uniref:Protein PTHB1 n=1 Tax=Elaeophora elaphi TaxID=1147741 RepID=A0A0R3RK48_9BILA
MSVFHVHEWLALELINANVCAVGELIEKRDQLVVGSVTGRIWIIDPGRASDTKQQLLSCLLEEDLPGAVLDIAIANFICGLEQNLIAILSPQKLIIYRLISDGEVYQLSTVYEHTISTIAYNMCIGTFGRATAAQICVQDMTCSLMVFEAENQLFHRSINLATALHPGPIIYTSHSDSIIIATSSAVLISYRYSVLATASSGKSGKKITANWTFSLGDYPLNLEVIDTALVQPSIIILCKRTLFCLTHGGTLRFTYRLQCVATSLLVYDSTHDAYVKLCIATASRMLLFFKDTILVWAAQLLQDAIQVRLCTFSSVYRSMLVILSNSRISVSYLGTEPSLFRLPAPQTRFIDFQQRHKEFIELEALIHKKPLESVEGTTPKNSLTLNCSYDGLDSRSRAEKSSEEVPSLTLNIELLSDVRLLDIKLLCSAAFHIEHKCTSFPAIDGSQKLSTGVYVLNQPVYDLRCKFYAFSSQFGDVIGKELKMPLNLMCHTVSTQRNNTQRNAQYKVTIESTLPALDISQLFPEFEAESNTAIGFQPYLSKMVILIYSSQKYKRYRIQAESLNFIYLFVDELIGRIQEKQPEAKLNCTLPLDQILHEIHVYAEVENFKFHQKL